MKAFAWIILITPVILICAFGESIVTLKSGEVLQGQILSDTNGVVHIRAFSHNHTISSLRDISHSDIQTIQTETPAQIAERTDYEALSRFQLNPNQEQTVDWYNQWIGAFQKFVKNYPDSDKLPAIRNDIALCQAESKNVAEGKVKFANQWMSVEAKRVAAAEYTIQSLKSQLADLQRQRDKLAENVAAAQGNLAAAQQKLSTLQDSQVPVYQTVTRQQHLGPGKVGGNAVTTTELAHDGYGNPIYTTQGNPERASVLSEIALYQQQLATGPQMLATFDRRIQDVRSQIAKAEQDYASARAQLSLPPPPSVGAPPTPP